MPFGRSKKDSAGDDLDSKKSSLFGGRSANSSKTRLSSTASPQPGSANPYANAPSANPYASSNVANDPYAPAPPTSSFGNMSLGDGQGSQPPSYSGGGYQRREEKSPVPAGGYGGAAPRYQSTGSYGSGGGGGGGGYGSDPYGGSAGQSQPQSRYGAGGYGGLGRSNSQDTMGTDAGRNALFGDAPQRAAQKPPPQPEQDSSYNNTGGYGATGGYDSTEMPGGYGSAPPRELTAEEQEEEDVQAAKQEIRFIKQQDVSSTRNARRIAEQSEQLGRETLARLGQQGERIHNTEKNLDMASHQNRIAEEKARELKTLNRSMFAVHVANPFTAKRREEAANAIALDKHQRERALAEATRSAAYSSQARQQETARDLNGNRIRTGGASRNLAERAKYQFEADSEDDEMENEIDDNLEAIHRGVTTLNKLGKAMGDEIASQNKHLDRITKKTDKVDDQITVNRARLDRIK